MSPSVSKRFLFLLAATWLVAVPLAAEEARSQADGPPLAVCFAPDTSEKYVGEVTSRYASVPEPLFQTDQSPSEFQLSNRWTVTATNGGGLGQGDPTTITWSYLADGTQIGGFAGEPASPSNLFAWLNSIYGNFNTWHAIFVQVFDRWGELTGNTYVYEPNDSGSFPGAPGLLGVRGDVRIGAHFIDGNSGILAYNFFPNTGDMVIDGFDSFYNDTSNNSLKLRNVLAHEHGHGMGLSHVCPVNQTKLMEPFVSTMFDGPQFDDILGAQRHYGDFFEHNDTSGTSTGLGFFASGTGGFENELSVDDNSDGNYYSFSTDGSDASVTIAPPNVAPYPQGPQNQTTGACNLPTPPFDPTNIHDLGVDLIDTDGTTVLATANSAPAGGTENLVSIPLPSGNGPYFIRVFGDPTNNIQPYELTLTTGGGVPCTQQTGPQSGRWNLPSGLTSGTVSGRLQNPPGTSVYGITATLTATSFTGGSVTGTLFNGVAPDPDYDVAGTYTITVQGTATTPAKGTWIADIFTAGTSNLVGRIGGEWKDYTPFNQVGKHAGRWKICD